MQFNQFPQSDSADPVAIHRETLREQARQLNVLAALAIPHVMEFPFPPLFVYFWNRCIQRLEQVTDPFNDPQFAYLVTQTAAAAEQIRFPKLALGIPRGHGKTIFLKLLVLYIILFTKHKFILLICARAELAEAIVSDVVDMLSHQNIRTLFGNWDSIVEVDRQDAKRFYFGSRTVILKGVGQGTSFRGIAEKFARPDVMIFDDAQTKESASSETTARAFAAWFRGTALKAKAPKFCFFLYVGNIYPKLELERPTATSPGLYGCMLRNLKNSRHWESIIVGGILADGSALWEDLQPKAQLLAEYQEDIEAGQEDVFLAEVMNDDDALTSRLFDATKVPAFPYPQDVVAQGSFLMIDPSLGKSTSDDQIVGWFKVVDGNVILWELRTYQVSAPQLVRSVLDWALEDQIPAIAIEDYAYQASLGQWFEEIMNPNGIMRMDGISGLYGIHILLVSRGRQSKNAGIKSMLRECMDGDLLLHPQVRSRLYNEISCWNPLKSNQKDNQLDVASYGNLVVNKYPVEIQVNLLLGHGRGYSSKSAVLDVGMHY